MRTVSDLFDFSIHFISSFISLVILLFLLPDIFNFLNVVDKYLRTNAEDFGTLADNEPPTTNWPTQQHLLVGR